MTTLPGVLVYATSEEDALARVRALAPRVLADRIEHGEQSDDLEHVEFVLNAPAPTA